VRRVTATVCALLALAAGLAGTAQAKTRFTLIGHGFGHGVGMSQYGALGYAEHGWTFDRILAHYYRGTTLGAAPTAQTSERVLMTAGKTSINVSAASSIQFVDEGGTTNVTLPAGFYGIRPGTNPGRLQVVDLASPSQPQVLHGLFGPVVAHPTTTNLVLHNSAGIGFRDDHWRGFFRVIETNHRVECINVVPVESYVAGVVPNEVPASWLQATLRAQAIAARSYAYRAQPRGDFDVYSDTRSQAYGPVEREQPRTTAAAAATSGMYVLYKGAVATTLFSSSSGGRTSSEQVAFGGDVGQPYLVPVNDPYDAAGGANPNHTWKPVVYTPAGLAATFGYASPVSSIDQAVDPASLRELRLILHTAAGSHTWTGLAVQAHLGLRSNYFRVFQVTLDRAPRTSRPGHAVGFTGRVWPRPTGTVRVLSRAVGAAAWKLNPVSVHVGPAGRFRFVERPSVSKDYRLRLGSGAVSPVIRVTVR
jgi:stage II sporulation protein D